MAKETTTPTPPPQPSIDPRFIYFVKRFNNDTKKFERTPALTADGHLDYAYKCGLEWINTEIVHEEIVITETGSQVHWVTVKATVHIRGVTFTGLASANSLVVSKAGFEVAVAETRAVKRAIASACNITEKLINPSGTIPTREFVEAPLEHEEEEREIPEEIRKPAEDVLPTEQW